MKSVVETLNPTRVKLLVEVPFDELKPSLDSAYKSIGSQVVIPGFRKGKVPPRVIDQRIGRAAVLEQAVNDALPGLYAQAVQENELEPLGAPEVDVTSFADGADLAFTAEVDVKPDFELPDYAGLAVEVSDADPADEEIDEQVDALRERFGTLKGVERPAADGDYVVIDLDATRDGEPVEGAQATGLSYKVGSGTMLDGLDEAITGLSEGDERTFSSTLLGDHAGEEVDVKVTVRGVKEQELPAADDDFAQMASEFDTLDELKDDLRARLARVKRLQQAVEARDKVMDVLLAQVDIPVPERFVADQVADHFAEEHGEEGHREEFEANVRSSLTSQFVLDAVATKEQVSVSQEELTDHLIRRAQQSGMDPNEFVQRVVQGGGVGSLVAEVARAKGLAALVQAATVTDASGRPVDLKRLKDDGSLATDEELADELAEADSADSEQG